MDDILRCACLTLAHVPDATLADVPALLADPHARAGLVREAGADPYLQSFWRWYEGLSEAEQASAAGPVLSKLRAVCPVPVISARGRQEVAAGPVH